MILSQEPQEQWTAAQKLVFRLVATHFFLYFFLLFFGSFFETPMRWFAGAVMQWDPDFGMGSTGSGDRTYDYVRLAFGLVLTLLTVATWSVLDRKRASYDKLFYWFQIFLRTILFVAMLLYGMAKVFKGQFPDASLVRLLQPVGDMSPMGLAWTFMGHSFFYNYFIGIAEVLGGALVLFRRTTTLGALVIVGVMSNVAVMNLTYDIPVKQFSIHLVLMALILMLVDSRRLQAVFFKNETVHQVNHYAPALNGTLQKLMTGFKILALVVITLAVAVQGLAQIELQNQLKSKSEFYGIWEVKTFSKGEETLAPLITDSYRWRYLIVDQKKIAAVKKMDDALQRYGFEIADASQEITFRKGKDGAPNTFTYHFPTPETLHLKGTLDGQALSIEFTKKPLTDFRLINRGFHWINETPYNQ